MGDVLLAPVGADLGGPWTPIGWTDDAAVEVDAEVDDQLPAAMSSWAGQTVCVEVPIQRFTAAMYWVLFRRRHPNLAKLRSSYRRRIKARRRR